MKEIIGIIALAGLIIIGIPLGIIAMQKKECLSSYQNFQPSYTFWAKCRIMVDGKLTPVDIVRELK